MALETARRRPASKPGFHLGSAPMGEEKAAEILASFPTGGPPKVEKRLWEMSSFTLPTISSLVAITGSVEREGFRC